MYFVSTDITPSELVKARSMTLKQDQVIYKFMIENSGEWDCWKLSDHFDFLITSLRRSLNTLERENKIERVGFVPGRAGKPVGSYRIKELKLF